MKYFIHRALLLVEYMLFLILNGSEKGAGLIRGHPAILALIGFRSLNLP